MTAAPQDGRDVIAMFLPQSPFVTKLGIVAEVLEADAKAIATYKLG